MKNFIYRISRGYTRCEVWYGNDNHARIGTSIVTPDKGLTRQQRQDIINKWLRARFGVKVSND